VNAHTKIEADAPFKLKANLEKPVVCFAVRLEALLRVRPFISKERFRYYLNGVYVHAHAEGGAVCVATDGHRLGVRRDVGGYVNEPQIVRLPLELKASKLLSSPWAVMVRSGTKFAHLSIIDAIHDRDHDTAENAIARLDECVQRFGDVLIDGIFPDYTRIIPQETDTDKVIGFNGKYISSFGESLTIRGSDSVAPHTVFDAGDPDFFGVIMPMRTSIEKCQDWVRGLTTPAA